MASALRVKLMSPDQMGFGLVVGRRSDTPPCLMVSCLRPGGEAAASGLIHPGDIILKINGTDVSHCPYSEARRHLEATDGDSELRLVIRAPLGYSTHLQTTFDQEGCPRTYRVTERIYSLAPATGETPNAEPARGSSGSINLNLTEGKDAVDTRRR
jgi:nitric-oxide synthase